MSDDLFYDYSGKIKNYASWYFIISVIASIIGGLGVWFTAMEADEGFKGFIIGAVIIAVGCFVSYLIAIFIYARGKELEDLEAIRHAVTSEPEITTYSAPRASGVTTSTSFRSTAPVSKHTTGTTWFCSHCGAKNEEARTYCNICGETR